MTSPTAEPVDRLLDMTIWPHFPGREDFTLGFEQLFMTIIPACIFIVVAPFYAWPLLQANPIVQSGKLLYIKMGLCICLISAEAVSLVLWSLSPVLRNGISIAAAAVSSISMIFVAFTIYASHIYSLKSLAVASVYLSLGLLFDAAKLRSYFSRDECLTVACISVVSVLSKLGLVLLEEVSKRSLLRQAEMRKSIAAEAVTGFWNRLTLLWFNPTVLFGHKHTLTTDDFYELGSEFESSTIQQAFQRVWRKADKKRNHSLLRVVIWTLRSSFCNLVIPRLAYTGFRFSQPFLFKQIILTVSEANSSPTVIGGLIGATAIVYFGSALSLSSYKHATCKTIIKTRGLLICTLLRKCLSLPRAVLQESSALTLLSTEIDILKAHMQESLDAWASLLEFGLATYVLATVVGRAVFVAVSTAIIVVYALFQISKLIDLSLEQCNGKAAARSSTASSLLSQLKSAKMCALEPAVCNGVQELYISEQQSSRKLLLNKALAFGFSTLLQRAPAVTVLAAAIFWSSQPSAPLSIPDIFMALATVILLTQSLSRVFFFFSHFSVISACFDRIQKFLLLDSLHDGRLAPHNPAIALTPVLSAEEQTRISLTSEYKFSAMERAALKLEPWAIQIIGASIQMAHESKTILHNATIRFPPGSLTMLLGPDSKETSAFLKALAGQFQLLAGRIFIDTRCVAFCGEAPWVENTTIQRNVIGGSQYSLVWYEAVLHACCLWDDIEDMAEGDQTLVGYDGCNLTYSQLQRIALARALYAAKSILILDNIFRKLGRYVSETILQRLFNSDGLLRAAGTTVVMTTNLVEHLPFADSILCLDKHGNIEQQSRATWNPPDGCLINDDDDLETDEDDTINALTCGKSETVLTGYSSSLDLTTKAPDKKRNHYLTYQHSLQSFGKLYSVMFLVSFMLLASIQRLPDIFLRIWMSIDFSSTAYFVGYAAVSILSVILIPILFWFFLLFALPGSTRDIHLKALTRIVSYPLTYFMSLDLPSFTKQLGHDVTSISRNLPQNLLEAVFYMCLVIVDLGIIVSGASFVAFILPLFFLCLFMLQKYFLNIFHQLAHLDAEAKLPLFNHFSEVLAGIEHIRAFEWQSMYLTRSIGELDHSQKLQYYLCVCEHWLQLNFELATSLVAIFLVTLSLTLKNTTSQSAIGLALVTLMKFGETVSFFARSSTSLESDLGALGRLTEIIESSTVEDDGELANERAKDLHANWPEQGKIEFCEMRTKYNPNKKSSPTNSINCQILPGQKVGIIGQTDSAATSIFLALLNSLQYSGNITIDNIDVKSIPRRLLRSRITTIPTDLVELPGSIRLNLCPFDGIPPNDEVLIDTLMKVELWDHVTLLGGLDAAMNTLQLSREQKQQLCIGRAIIHHKVTGSKIVLVDEVTRHLDETTAINMASVIVNAFEGCSMLAVAHTREIKDKMDAMLEMDRGRISVCTGRRRTGSSSAQQS